MTTRSCSNWVAGKGEYTVGLARLFPDKNFIGVDIKGAVCGPGPKIPMTQE